MKKYVLFLLIAMSPVSLCQSIRSTLQFEFQRHPKSQIQDLYKFAYQAAMGNAHFVESLKDSIALLQDVQEQLRLVDTTSNEPFITFLTPDSSIVRFHLRAAKELNIRPEDIVSAILTSAKLITPSQEQFINYIIDLEKLADDALLPFSYDAVHSYCQKMKELGFPPVHHSEEYIKEYSPVYYVISGKCASKLLEGKCQ